MSGHASAALGIIVGQVALWLRRASERRSLHELDDHLLKDIGLDRGEALAEMRPRFWDGDDGRRTGPSGRLENKFLPLAGWLRSDL